MHLTTATVAFLAALLSGVARIEKSPVPPAETRVTPGSSTSTLAAPQAGKINTNKSEEKVSFQSLTPNLIVNDVDRSAAFYRDVLGFQQLKTVPEKPPFIFLWMKQGAVDVFLNAPQANPAPGVPAPLVGKSVPGTISLYIKVQGIEELAARVEQHGVKPAIAMHKEFYGMKEFAVLDPDGYLMIFAEPAP
jgi:catechol 2,3-dioxygenase-like lactoylglutathione lyase family enzyme